MDAESSLEREGANGQFRDQMAHTNIKPWQEGEEENLCVPVDAVGLVVALEVARQRAGVPVVADEHDILP